MRIFKLGRIRETDIRVAVPFANLYPEDKLFFILIVLTALVFGAAILHHGFEKAHQSGITSNKTEDGNHTANINTSEADKLVDITNYTDNISYQAANNYPLMPQEIKDELECVGKCDCWGVLEGSGEPCDLCVQECLFETRLSHDYFELMSDVFHKHPYMDDVWDCSNISWEVMKGLQGRGYDVWFCGGFYRNNSPEAHAWLLVKKGNRTIPLDSGVIIPDEVYYNDYNLVECSNKTYFDTVTIDLDENEQGNNT